MKMIYSAVSGFSSASFVAQEQGLFRKRGIDVEFQFERYQR